jgi:polynucleotide 5'-kinase involved in rRNA processing
VNCRELSQTNRRVRTRNIIHKHGQQLGQSDQVVSKVFYRYANTVLAGANNSGKTSLITLIKNVFTKLRLTR